jgi:hypothetical protein
VRHGASPRGLARQGRRHGNQKLDLDNLHHGMLSAAYLFEEMAETGTCQA